MFALPSIISQKNTITVRYSTFSYCPQDVSLFRPNRNKNGTFSYCPQDETLLQPAKNVNNTFKYCPQNELDFVFLSETTPSTSNTYSVGQQWLQPSTQIVKIWNGTAWVDNIALFIEGDNSNSSNINVVSVYPINSITNNQNNIVNTNTLDIQGSVLYFPTGTSNCLIVNSQQNPIIDQSSSFSIDFWIKPENIFATNYAAPIVELGGQATGTYGNVRIRTTRLPTTPAGKVAIAIMGITANNDSLINISAWSHVAVVYTSTGTARVYVNGIKTVDQSASFTVQNNSNIKIGEITGSRNALNYVSFEGYLDQIRVRQGEWYSSNFAPF